MYAHELPMTVQERLNREQEERARKWKEMEEKRKEEGELKRKMFEFLGLRLLPKAALEQLEDMSKHSELELPLRPVLKRLLKIHRDVKKEMSASAQLLVQSPPDDFIQLEDDEENPEWNETNDSSDAPANGNETPDYASFSPNYTPSSPTYSPSSPSYGEDQHEGDQRRVETWDNDYPCSYTPDYTPTFSNSPASPRRDESNGNAYYQRRGYSSPTYRSGYPSYVPLSPHYTPSRRNHINEGRTEKPRDSGGQQRARQRLVGDHPAPASRPPSSYPELNTPHGASSDHRPARDDRTSSSSTLPRSSSNCINEGVCDLGAPDQRPERQHSILEPTLLRSPAFPSNARSYPTRVEREVKEIQVSHESSGENQRPTVTAGAPGAPGAPGGADVADDDDDDVRVCSPSPPKKRPRDDRVSQRSTPSPPSRQSPSPPLKEKKLLLEEVRQLQREVEKAEQEKRWRETDDARRNYEMQLIQQQAMHHMASIAWPNGTPTQLVSSAQFGNYWRSPHPNQNIPSCPSLLSSSYRDQQLMEERRSKTLNRSSSSLHTPSRSDPPVKPFDPNKVNPCPFCSKPHLPEFCTTHRTADSREDIRKELGLCAICFGKHSKRNCPTPVETHKCAGCGRHSSHVALCRLQFPKRRKSN